MKLNMTRRELTASIALGVCGASMFGSRTASAVGYSRTTGKRSLMLLFTSSGRTGCIDTHGGGLHYFDFKVPEQVTWQLAPIFADKRRMVFSEHGS